MYGLCNGLIWYTPHILYIYLTKSHQLSKHLLNGHRHTQTHIYTNIHTHKNIPLTTLSLDILRVYTYAILCKSTLRIQNSILRLEFTRLIQNPRLLQGKAYFNIRLYICSSKHFFENNLYWTALRMFIHLTMMT